MNQSTAATVTMIYGAALHVAGLAAVATLVGVGAIPPDVGMPIVGALLGVGVGAGAALIVPGSPATPSSGPAQPPSAGGVASAPTPTDAPVAPVQAVTAPATHMGATGPV